MFWSSLRLEDLEQDAHVSAINRLCEIHGIAPIKAKELVEIHGITTIEALHVHQNLLNSAQKIGLKHYKDMKVK